MEAIPGVIAAVGDDGAVDTIFALASGPPPAGIAVVRISGPQAGPVLDALAGRRPPPRYGAFRRLVHPVTGEALDEGLVLFFPGPRSFTGEDVVELHLHGGRAVVAGVLMALGTVPGMRLAEPGEFSRRAFLHGRMDLTQAEAIADLVAAETEAQKRLALAQSRGSIRTQYEFWRERLIRARALIEAELDFSDEEGTAGAWSDGVRADLHAMAAEMDAALGDVGRGQRIREGAEIVILGPPNVGKSSLLNALAGREAAIVAREAGTTRDMIEVTLDLGGYRATLVDTAGLRETESAVEREGVRRALLRGGEAELVLWLFDAESAAAPPAGLEGRIVRVRTKADLIDSGTERRRIEADHILSARTGDGIEGLIGGLTAFLQDRLKGGDSALVTRERHRVALGIARAALGDALNAAVPEIAAEDLRRASDAVGRVVGRVDVEEVLDVVFKSFCIGK